MSTSEATPDIEWVVSASPHLRETESTARIMWSVVAALVPAGVWSVYLFGAAVLYVIALCVGTSVLAELAIQRLRHRPQTISDGSAVVTGLLLAYVLPSHAVVIGASGEVRLTLLKWQVPVLGALVAIAIAKHCFGGLGHNIWNPALIGRAFVQLAFASHVSLTRWPWPPGGPDAITRATALSSSAAAANFPVRNVFFGYIPGSLGEVSALLLLLGALYLMIRRYVDWRLPLGYLLALVALATLFAWSPRDEMVPWMADFARRFQALRQGEAAFGAFFGDWSAYAARQIFSGGVMLGAFFMATDMVTSPLSHKGQIVFGIGCGVFTALIRFYTGYPEGVCYAILLMNTVRPYVDRYTRPRVLGEGKE